MDLATVLHSAVETSRPLVEQFGHTPSVTLPPAPVHLHADPARLAQVFSNLLNNASKYTEPGGPISLMAEVTGSGGASTSISCRPASADAAVAPTARMVEKAVFGVEGAGKMNSIRLFHPGTRRAAAGRVAADRSGTQ